MKTKLIFVLLFAVLLPAMTGSAEAQDYFADTVWTKKTDQMAGFWKVKFSQTDTFIVGHGYEMDLFFDATRQKIYFVIRNIVNGINYFILKTSSLWLLGCSNIKIIE